MGRIILAVTAAALLSGCAGVLGDVYDEQARTECEQNTDARERGACLDRVDQNRRDRR